LPLGTHQEVVYTIGHVPPLRLAPPRLPIQRVNASAFNLLSKQHSVKIFLASLIKIDKLLASFGKELIICEYGLTIDKEHTLNKPLELNKDNHENRYKIAASLLFTGASIEDIRKALALKVYLDLKTKVLEHIHNLLST
jgi:hypothetical protein